MLRVCTLQHVDNFENEEKIIDFSSLAPLSINYSQVEWKNVAALAALHVGALAGWIIFFLGHICWQTVFWTVFLMLYSGISVTLGAHRLWTHRSFKATLPLKLLLLIGQTISGQNCLWVWVRNHRQHHKYSDTDADPHNSKRGFFFSHVGWLMMQKHPEVVAKGRQIDMTDLTADPHVIFQKRYYKTLYILIAVVMPVFIPWCFWNEDLINSLFVCYIARYTLQLNITWCVNSAAHMFGTKPYDKEMDAAENPLVAFLALGEGWHNFHHAFPWDCKTSEFGQYLNFSSCFLDLFAYLGLAYDLRTATKEMVMNTVIKHGDGSHPLSRNFDELAK